MAESTPFEVVSAQFEAMGLSTINLQSQPAYSQVRRKDERGPLNHGQVYCQIRGVLVGDVAGDGVEAMAEHQGNSSTTTWAATMAGLRSFTAVWTQFEAMAPPTISL
jgi:hypothetical protein